MVPTPPSPEMYQIAVIASMIFAVSLKTIGMYYNAKAKYPDIVFNYGYVVSAIMGVFTAFGAYMAANPYGDTVISTFMFAGLFALGMNLSIEFAGKAIAPAASTPETPPNP
jgi:predicted membrane channel-forming protein YqfA (hemolysin III family)